MIMMCKKTKITMVTGLIALSVLSLLLLHSACKRDDRPVYQILEPSSEVSQEWESAGFEELVGPSGNPYADPEFYLELESLKTNILPPRIEQILERLIPSTHEIQSERKERGGVVSWEIEAVTKNEDEYDCVFLETGEIFRFLSYVDGEIEAPGRIFLQGNLKEATLDQIPPIIIENARFLTSKKDISKVYSVQALGGFRFFIQFGEGKDGLIFSFTETGDLRSAGGEKAMLRPFKPPKIESIEDIQSNLSKYGDKYHVRNMIKRIQDFRIDENHGFRFVVVGDTRSNLKVFQAITKSINKWNPLFAIDTGDLTLYGYSQEMDRYHFQTLEKYAPYPFLPVVGNHDVRRGDLSYEYAFGGKDSRVYHFDVGRCRFVVLDNTGSKGAIPWEEQLSLADKWLKKRGVRKFVFLHLPPLDVEKWAYHSMSAAMSTPFVKLMTEHKVDHVFSGHIHSYSTATHEGINYTVAGASGAGLHKHYGEMGSVHNYVVVDVLPEGVQMRLVRFIPQDE
jgi:Icc-related predicted phosphoesterase